MSGKHGVQRACCIPTTAQLLANHLCVKIPRNSVDTYCGSQNGLLDTEKVVMHLVQVIASCTVKSCVQTVLTIMIIYILFSF